MIKYPNPIKPEKLDLVMRDHDHVIYYAEKPLLSPGGNEIADPDIRLLKHILVKLTIYGKIDPFSVNSFAIFCFQKDHIAQDDDLLGDRPVLQFKFLNARVQGAAGAADLL